MSSPDQLNVTVVIPVWDRYVAYLPEAVASARRQLPRSAVLVVDNASTVPLGEVDATVVRVAGRLSLGAARDLGLEHASTHWVLLLDADDLLAPDTIGRLLQETVGPSCPVVVVPRIVDGGTGLAHHWPRASAPRLSRRPWLFFVANAVWSQYPTVGVLVDRRAALRSGGFGDHDNGDDWVLGAALCFRGEVRFVEHFGRVYRRHEGSVSAPWGAVDVMRHGRQVRRRLRGNRHIPNWAVLLPCLLALVQVLGTLLVRPVARGLRRRKGTECALPRQPVPTAVHPRPT